MTIFTTIENLLDYPTKDLFDQFNNEFNLMIDELNTYIKVKYNILYDKYIPYNRIISHDWRNIEIFIQGAIDDKNVELGAARFNIPEIYYSQYENESDELMHIKNFIIAVLSNYDYDIDGTYIDVNEYSEDDLSPEDTSPLAFLTFVIPNKTLLQMKTCVKHKDVIDDYYISKNNLEIFK